MGLRADKILNDSWSRWLIIATLALNGSLWLIIWRLFPHADNVVPLHYTIYFGINLTGSWYRLFILPGVGLLVIISHYLVGRMGRHEMWGRMWSLLSLIINILAFIAAAMVIYLVRINVN